MSNEYYTNVEVREYPTAKEFVERLSPVGGLQDELESVFVIIAVISSFADNKALIGR